MPWRRIRVDWDRTTDFVWTIYFRWWWKHRYFLILDEILLEFRFPINWFLSKLWIPYIFKHFDISIWLCYLWRHLRTGLLLWGSTKVFQGGWWFSFLRCFDYSIEDIFSFFLSEWVLLIFVFEVVLLRRWFRLVFRFLFWIIPNFLFLTLIFIVLMILFVDR